MNSELNGKRRSSLDKLETFLLKLNLESDNRLTILRDIRHFLTDGSQFIRSCSLNQFLLGDQDMPGIIKIFCLESERNSLVDAECRFTITQS